MDPPGQIIAYFTVYVNESAYDSQELFYNISKLGSNQLVRVQVSATNGAGEGPRSEVTTGRTGKSGTFLYIIHIASPPPPPKKQQKNNNNNNNNLQFMHDIICVCIMYFLSSTIIITGHRQRQQHWSYCWGDFSGWSVCCGVHHSGCCWDLLVQEEEAAFP